MFVLKSISFSRTASIHIVMYFDYIFRQRIPVDFAAPVTEGTGDGIHLCSGWAPDNFCSPIHSSVPVPRTNTFFIGKKVIINPGADLTSGL